MQEWLVLLKEPPRQNNVQISRSSPKNAVKSKQAQQSVPGIYVVISYFYIVISHFIVTLGEALREYLLESWWNLIIVFLHFSVIGFLSTFTWGLIISVIWVLAIIVSALSDSVPLKDISEKYYEYVFHFVWFGGAPVYWLFFWLNSQNFDLKSTSQSFNLDKLHHSIGHIIVFIITFLCLFLGTYWNRIIFFKLWDSIEYSSFKSRLLVCFTWTIVCLLGLGLGSLVFFINSHQLPTGLG